MKVRRCRNCTEEDKKDTPALAMSLDEATTKNILPDASVSKSKTSSKKTKDNAEKIAGDKAKAALTAECVKMATAGGVGVVGLVGASPAAANTLSFGASIAKPAVGAALRGFGSGGGFGGSGAGATDSGGVPPPPPPPAAKPCSTTMALTSTWSAPDDASASADQGVVSHLDQKHSLDKICKEFAACRLEWKPASIKGFKLCQGLLFLLKQGTNLQDLAEKLAPPSFNYQLIRVLKDSSQTWFRANSVYDDKKEKKLIVLTDETMHLLQKAKVKVKLEQVTYHSADTKNKMPCCDMTLLYENQWTFFVQQTTRDLVQTRCCTDEPIDVHAILNWEYRFNKCWNLVKSFTSLGKRKRY
jgi:hypothetical protein